LDFPLKYIGQTERTSKIRHKVHFQAIRNNNSNSEYSSHILNTGHTYGTTTDNMNRYGRHKKGKERQIFKNFRKISYLQD
jgi:hypothetical protein